MNEILHYCKDCCILFSKCEIVVPHIAVEWIDPVTLKTRYHYIKKDMDNIKYICSICGNDITDGRFLLAGDLYKQYYSLLATPIQIKLTRREGRQEFINKMEAWIFDNNL